MGLCVIHELFLHLCIVKGKNNKVKSIYNSLTKHVYFIHYTHVCTYTKLLEVAEFDKLNSICIMI